MAMVMKSFREKGKGKILTARTKIKHISHFEQESMLSSWILRRLLRECV